MEELFLQKVGSQFLTLDKEELLKHVFYKEIFLKTANNYCGMSNRICTDIVNTHSIESDHNNLISRIIFYNDD